MLDLHPTHYWSEIGTESAIVNGEMFDVRYSLTLLTSLDPTMDRCVVVDFRKKSNNQWDFLKFMVDSIANQYLKPVSTHLSSTQQSPVFCSLKST